MKRYLVFAYDNYYPTGGWNDFNEDFDNLADAIVHADNLILVGVKPHRYDFADVVDTTTKSQVYNCH